jgi:NDP-sugar pyrophosphorylase family protein
VGLLLLGSTGFIGKRSARIVSDAYEIVTEIDGENPEFVDLTSLDFTEPIEYCRKLGNPATIRSYKKEIQLPPGVLELSGASVRDYIEKPRYSFDISVGIHAMNRKVVDHVPKNQHFDFPTLIKRLISAQELINVYKFEGDWYDIGREEDYKAVLEKCNAEKQD